MPYTRVGQTTTNNYDALSANYKYVGRYQMTVSGEVFHYSYKNYLGYGTKRCRFIIYSDNASSPDAFLYSGEEVNQYLADSTWMKWFPSVRKHLNAGYYHIGMHNSGSSWYPAYQTSTGTNNKKSDTYSDGPSDPFGTVDSPAQTYALGCYMDYVSGDGIDVAKVVSYAVLSNNEEEEEPEPEGETALPQVILF